MYHCGTVYFNDILHIQPNLYIFPFDGFFLWVRVSSCEYSDTSIRYLKINPDDRTRIHNATRNSTESENYSFKFPISDDVSHAGNAAEADNPNPEALLS